MRVGLSLPEERALLRVKGVYRARVIAEERGARRLDDIKMSEHAFQLLGNRRPFRLAQFPDRDGRAAAGGSVEGPISTAGFGVERIDAAGGTGQKQSAVHHGGLTEL